MENHISTFGKMLAAAFGERDAWTVGIHELGKHGISEKDLRIRFPRAIGPQNKAAVTMGMDYPDQTRTDQIVFSQWDMAPPVTMIFSDIKPNLPGYRVHVYLDQGQVGMRFTHVNPTGLHQVASFHFHHDNVTVAIPTGIYSPKQEIDMNILNASRVYPMAFQSDPYVAQVWGNATQMLNDEWQIPADQLLMRTDEIVPRILATDLTELTNIYQVFDPNR